MRIWSLRLAGTLMILSAAAHGCLGWPAMRTGLLAAGVGSDLLGAMAAGWLFGSAAMLAFGGIVFRAALRLKRGDASGVFAVRLIAACYLVFGTATFVLLHFNPFFLLFVVTGILAGAPVLRAGGSKAAGR